MHQHRIHLEVVWHALENAGIDPISLSGQRVGIFVGVFSEDYKLLNKDNKNSAYFATGSSSSVAAGSVAYFLNTKGAAITINTACSSSLVAIDLATKGLINHDFDLAIASGVNVILMPEMSSHFNEVGMLSPDGRCKVFDSSANGYVRGEGCGVVILKRLSDSLQNRHRIQGIIEASVLNQDGKSSVLTAPNPVSQRDLLSEALQKSKLQAMDIDYFEAHGTGYNSSTFVPISFSN